MTAVLDPAPAAPMRTGTRLGPGGGAAMRRWAWRLWKREWRQQVLIQLLIVVAVAATILGLALATNVPKPATTTLILQGSDPSLATDLAAIGRVAGPDVVGYHDSYTLPGSVATIDVRSESGDPKVLAGQLTVLAGTRPGPGQAALTPGVASELGLRIGQPWTYAGRSLRIVGLVQNPGNFDDQFALVAPGVIANPANVTVSVAASEATAVGDFQLPSGHPVGVQAEGPETAAAVDAIVLSLATLLLLFVALLASAGFAVMAQRRLRALGMLGAVGATDRQIRAVMVVNGALVGSVGALAGTAVGLASWRLWAPHLAASAGHRIRPWSLPWWAVVTGALLAVVAATGAAWWPARAAARIPVVQALSGRPPRPKAGHRPAALGAGLLVVGLAALAFARHNQPFFTVTGIVAATIGILILAPLAIAGAGAAAGRGPIQVRLALRDLARFSARSGSALAAITLAVLIAAAIAVSVARQAGENPTHVPNLPSNEMAVYLDPGVGEGLTPLLSPAQVAAAGQQTQSIAASVASSAPLLLERAVDPNGPVPGVRDKAGFGPTGRPAAALVKIRQVSQGFEALVNIPLYVATPALLDRYHVTGISPAAEVLTSRPDPAGLELVAGDPKNATVQPVIQHASLPTDTSDPNSLITQKGVADLGLQAEPVGWLLEAPHPLTAAQINVARRLALAAGLTIETRSSPHSLTALGHEVTLAGVLVALGVLAMTVGLIRSETANDLRTLAATGASPRTRRALTAATAGALAGLGALIGVTGAYAGLAAWFRHGLSGFAYCPFADLLGLLVGLPLVAIAAGWLLAGREPKGMARNPIE